MNLDQLKNDFIEKETIGTGDPWIKEAYDEFKKIVENLEVTKEHEILYIGAGSGFGPYVLSHLVKTVHAYELPNNIQKTEENLKPLREKYGLENLNLLEGDGFQHDRKVDRIIIAACTPENSGIEEYLREHLNENGIAIVPEGKLREPIKTGIADACGHVFKYTKRNGELYKERIFESYSIWHPLEGKYGFEKEEIERIASKPGLLDEELL